MNRNEQLGIEWPETREELLATGRWKRHCRKGLKCDYVIPIGGSILTNGLIHHEDAVSRERDRALVAEVQRLREALDLALQCQAKTEAAHDAFRDDCDRLHDENRQQASDLSLLREELATVSRDAEEHRAQLRAGYEERLATQAAEIERLRVELDDHRRNSVEHLKHIRTALNATHPDDTAIGAAYRVSADSARLREVVRGLRDQLIVADGEWRELPSCADVVTELSALLERHGFGAGASRP